MRNWTRITLRRLLVALPPPGAREGHGACLGVAAAHGVGVVAPAAHDEPAGHASHSDCALLDCSAE